MTIVDYGAGNLNSVQKAFQALGVETAITADPKVVARASALILPGVGAFGAAVKSLREGGLAEVLGEKISGNTPFLGICLGLQLLFDCSEEGPAQGLGLLGGQVKRFPSSLALKVPHMGWNQVHRNGESRLLAGTEEGEYYYFVHSYYLEADNREHVVGQCEYGMPFDAVVERGNLFATQFHPEKSGRAGLQVLKNFVDIAQGRAY